MYFNDEEMIFKEQQVEVADTAGITAADDPVRNAVECGIAFWRYVG